MGEGRESPPPETQSDKQMGKTGDAQGVDNASNKEEVNKAQLEVRGSPGIQRRCGRANSSLESGIQPQGPARRCRQGQVQEERGSRHEAAVGMDLQK